MCLRSLQKSCSIQLLKVIKLGIIWFYTHFDRIKNDWIRDFKVDAESAAHVERVPESSICIVLSENCQE